MITCSLEWIWSIRWSLGPQAVVWWQNAQSMSPVGSLKSKLALRAFWSLPGVVQQSGWTPVFAVYSGNDQLPVAGQVLQFRNVSVWQIPYTLWKLLTGQMLKSQFTIFRADKVFAWLITAMKDGGPERARTIIFAKAIKDCPHIFRMSKELLPGALLHYVIMFHSRPLTHVKDTQLDMRSGTGLYSRFNCHKLCKYGGKL